MQYIEDFPRFEQMNFLFLRYSDWVNKMQDLIKIILDRILQLTILQENKIMQLLKCTFDNIIKK